MLTSQWEGGIPASGRQRSAPRSSRRRPITGTYVSSSSLIVKSRHVRAHRRRRRADRRRRPTRPTTSCSTSSAKAAWASSTPRGSRRSPAPSRSRCSRATTADAAQRDKFISEAVVTGELDHPNIVPIYDLGANDDGALFYSMKRVKGTPWHKVIKEKSLDENLQHPAARRRRGGVRPRQRRDPSRPEARERHARRLRRGAGDGLGPGAGQPRVPQRGDRSASRDAMGGTPAYMAPEMATGPLEKITAGQRRVPAGRHPVRDHHRQAAAHRQDGDGVPVRGGQERDRAAGQVGRAGRHRPQGDGHRARGAARRACRTSRPRSATTRRTPRACGCSSIAGENLDKAAKAQDYELYARALYALEESLALWPGNARAEALLATAPRRLRPAGARQGRLRPRRLAARPGRRSAPRRCSPSSTPAAASASRGSGASSCSRAPSAALVAAVIGIVSVAYCRGQPRARRSGRPAQPRRRGARGSRRRTSRRPRAPECWKPKPRSMAEQETERAVAAEKLAEERSAAEEIAKREADVAASNGPIADEAIADADRRQPGRRGIRGVRRPHRTHQGEARRERVRPRRSSCWPSVPPELRNWEWGRLQYLTQLSERTWRADGAGRRGGVLARRRPLRHRRLGRQGRDLEPRRPASASTRCRTASTCTPWPTTPRASGWPPAAATARSTSTAPPTASS